MVEIQKSALIKAYEAYRVELAEEDVHDFFISLEQQSKDILDDECERNLVLTLHYKRILDGFYQTNISTKNQLELYILELESMGKNDIWEFKKDNTFESHLRTRGQEIFLMASMENGSPRLQTRAIVIKTVHNQSEFFLRRNIELSRGCYIQIIGSSDWWKVVDKEDYTYLNQVIHLKAFTVKVDEKGSEIHSINQHSSAVVYGNILGGLQVGGTQNSQTAYIKDALQFTEAPLDELPKKRICFYKRKYDDTVYKVTATHRDSNEFDFVLYNGEDEVVRIPHKKFEEYWFVDSDES